MTPGAWRKSGITYALDDDSATGEVESRGTATVNR
jgi:hypothetical protein